MFAPLSNNGGAQVWIEVKSGLSKKFAVSPTGGFEYHIHVKPVGSNNDCMATGGHLDPANVGAAKCMAAKPDKCQEGDLSGTSPFFLFVFLISCFSWSSLSSSSSFSSSCSFCSCWLIWRYVTDVTIPSRLFFSLTFSRLLFFLSKSRYSFSCVL